MKGNSRTDISSRLLRHGAPREKRHTCGEAAGSNWRYIRNSPRWAPRSYTQPRKRCVRGAESKYRTRRERYPRTRGYFEEEETYTAQRTCVRCKSTRRGISNYARYANIPEIAETSRAAMAALQRHGGGECSSEANATPFVEVSVASPKLYRRRLETSHRGTAGAALANLGTIYCTMPARPQATAAAPTIPHCPC